MFKRQLEKPWLRSLVLASMVLLFLTLTIVFAQVTTPLLISLAIAYVFDPVIDWLETKKLGRTTGIVVVTFVLTLTFFAFLAYVIPVLIRQTQELIQNIPGYVNQIEKKLVPEVQKLYQEHQEEVDTTLHWLKEQAIVNGSSWAKKVGMGLVSSFRGFGNLLGNLLSLVVIPVLAFYLLRDFDLMRHKIVSFFPLDRKDLLMDLFQELHQSLSKFIQGQLLVAMILATIYSIGLTISGCPAPLLIGILAGMANLVPYLGLAVGLLPALLLTYLSGGTLPQVLGAGLTFGIGQALEGTLITPRVVGDSVGLHPVLVMVALMIGGTYFGLTGMILALPVAAILAVFFKRAARFYHNSALFLGPNSQKHSPQPSTSPSANPTSDTTTRPSNDPEEDPVKPRE